MNLKIFPINYVILLLKDLWKIWGKILKIIILIINDICYTINLGDSRALYSYNSGNKFYQLSRDHKPNDPIERERVEKAGGKVYKDEFVNIKGEKRRIEEKDLAPGMFLPYRIIPGNIAVSNIIINNNFIIGIKKHRRF